MLNWKLAGVISSFFQRRGEGKTHGVVVHVLCTGKHKGGFKAILKQDTPGALSVECAVLILRKGDTHESLGWNFLVCARYKLIYCEVQVTDSSEKSGIYILAPPRGKL